jgi:hypothetical protein
LLWYASLWVCYFYIIFVGEFLAHEINKCIGVLSCFLSGMLYQAYNYQCWIAVFIQLIAIPLVTIGIPIRMFEFYSRNVFSNALLETDALDDFGIEGVTTVEDDNDEFVGFQDAIKLVFCFCWKSNSDDAHKSLLTSPPTESSVSTATLAKRAREMTKADGYRDERKHLRVLKKLISNSFLAFVCFIILLPFIVTIIITLSLEPYVRVRLLFLFFSSLNNASLKEILVQSLC